MCIFTHILIFSIKSSTYLFLFYLKFPNIWNSLWSPYLLFSNSSSHFPRSLYLTILMYSKRSLDGWSTVILQLPFSAHLGLIHYLIDLLTLYFSVYFTVLLANYIRWNIIEYTRDKVFNPRIKLIFTLTLFFIYNLINFEI